MVTQAHIGIVGIESISFMDIMQLVRYQIWLIQLPKPKTGQNEKEQKDNEDMFQAVKFEIRLKLHEFHLTMVNPFPIYSTDR